MPRQIGLPHRYTPVKGLLYNHAGHSSLSPGSGEMLPPRYVCSNALFLCSVLLSVVFFFVKKGVFFDGMEVSLCFLWTSIGYNPDKAGWRPLSERNVNTNFPPVFVYVFKGLRCCGRQTGKGERGLYLGAE